MNDLLGGQVDFLCDQTTNTTAQIKAGIKAYAVTSRRIDALPDLPTAAEAGLPDVKVTSGMASTSPPDTRTTWSRP